jgi:hypothetical protein
MWLFDDDKQPIMIILLTLFKVNSILWHIFLSFGIVAAIF